MMSRPHPWRRCESLPGGGRCGGSSLDGWPRMRCSSWLRLGWGARCRIRFVELLQATAEGLPLFVEELLGGLIAAGALRRQGDEWQADERIGLRLRPGFVAGVEERVAALADPAPVVLAAAAVLGRSFDTALLSACTGLSASEVSAALRAGADARLVEADRELGMDTDAVSPCVGARRGA